MSWAARWSGLLRAWPTGQARPSGTKAAQTGCAEQATAAEAQSERPNRAAHVAWPRHGAHFCRKDPTLFSIQPEIHKHCDALFIRVTQFAFRSKNIFYFNFSPVFFHGQGRGAEEGRLWPIPTGGTATNRHRGSLGPGRVRGRR